MKKTIIAAILLLCSIFGATAQTPYYDAFELKKLESGKMPDGRLVFYEKDSVILASILKNYVTKPVYFAEIVTSFSTNPFMKITYHGKMENRPTNTLKIADYTLETTRFDANQEIRSLGSLDVTTLADGFAKFIVTRTKQELNIAFFYKFQEEMKKPEYADLRSLFPQTNQALSAIGNEIYNYEGYLQTLRQCFIFDLNALPNNLPDIIENHRDFFEKFPEMESYLRSGCYIAGELRNKTHPGDILRNYPLNYIESRSKKGQGSIKTLMLVSSSLQRFPVDKTKYWVDLDAIKALAKDTLTFRIYLGLIYQQAKLAPYDSIEFNKTSFIAVLDTLAKNYDQDYPKFAKYIQQFGEKTEAIKTHLNSPRPTTDSAAVEFFAKHMELSLDLFKHTSKAGNLPYVNAPEMANSLKDFFDVAKTTCNLTLNINRCNYGAAIVNTVHIYDVVVYKKLVNPATGRLEKEQYGITPGTLEKIYKYGNLMATIAQAQNSEEVATAIDAIALPPGSARIKRESKFNVSINAYCGLYGGYEKIKGVDRGYNEVTFRKWNSYGVAAPIGFAISGGQQHIIPFINSLCKKQRHWSHSLFISVVDIGALAAYRFTNDSTETVPKIELQNIISPGIFYSVGIPKSPISLNIGYQVGPLLRKVTAIKNDYDKSYGRFSVSICVDLPLLNLYNKPR